MKCQGEEEAVDHGLSAQRKIVHTLAIKHVEKGELGRRICWWGDYGKICVK